MRKWFYALVALLLAAPAVQAQNSYNIWTADPAAPITPLRKKTRPVKPAPAPVVAAAPAKPAAEEPRVKQSKLIKRGLTQRMHEHKPLAEDSVSMVFFRENSRYPVEAQKAGAQGSVVIKLEIQPDGEVSKTSILSMQPRVVAGRAETVPVAAMQSLADEAQRIFRMLRFEPAARTSVEELTASFSLN
ncbi:energy transducer TonB [Hymenobacter sp. GOD-10R]|uniref:energy transducer TonB n=1 Tax=Hymenobacter sp. GOD-10R TaxID=3093922 RepID=UPI002D78538D|nr:energy transducer TonB [Hymenobacter sp. GOD-10R]WRQ31009.1 energy transducer TonB [Hymenobacter sp. GOD-10R]